MSEGWKAGMIPSPSHEASLQYFTNQADSSRCAVPHMPSFLPRTDMNVHETATCICQFPGIVFIISGQNIQLYPHYIVGTLVVKVSTRDESCCHTNFLSQIPLKAMPSIPINKAIPSVSFN